MNTVPNHMTTAPASPGEQHWREWFHVLLSLGGYKLYLDNKLLYKPDLNKTP